MPGQQKQIIPYYFSRSVHWWRIERGCGEGEMKRWDWSGVRKIWKKKLSAHGVHFSLSWGWLQVQIHYMQIDIDIDCDFCANESNRRKNKPDDRRLKGNESVWKGRRRICVWAGRGKGSKERRVLLCWKGNGVQCDMIWSFDLEGMEREEEGSGGTVEVFRRCSCRCKVWVIGECVEWVLTEEIWGERLRTYHHNDLGQRIGEFHVEGSRL